MLDIYLQVVNYGGISSKFFLFYLNLPFAIYSPRLLKSSSSSIGAGAAVTIGTAVGSGVITGAAVGAEVGRAVAVGCDVGRTVAVGADVDGVAVGRSVAVGRGVKSIPEVSDDTPEFPVGRYL